MGQVNPGKWVTVVAGPQCADNYPWWLVEADGLKGWTVEGDSAAYWLIAERDLPLDIGSTMVSDKDGMMLVYVPAGDFLMGSSEADIAQALLDCPTCNFNVEQPQHKVYLDAFWIDETDVTNAMYALCVSAGPCPGPEFYRSSTRPNYYGNAQYAHYPVTWVSWNDANAYCAWAGRQLPTEAQWEKAARGADGRIYPWGNQAPGPTLLNFNGQVGDTTEVGHYLPGASPYGALDMEGNVEQWVADWYDANYYANALAQNPMGPASGQSGRAVRGNAWSAPALTARAAYRGSGGPDLRIGTTGFRCSRSS